MQRRIPPTKNKTSKSERKRAKVTLRLAAIVTWGHVARSYWLSEVLNGFHAHLRRSELHVLFIPVLIAATTCVCSAMSPKVAKYRTAHAYGKRRKPWNKRRKLDTEANAADLAEQETPAHVGDRESPPVCDCDSVSVCAAYDLTAGRVDGACGV